MSLGADVKLKLRNMVVWIAAYAPNELAPQYVHIINKMRELSVTEAVVFAQQIAEALPDERTFEALLQRDLPEEVRTALRDVVVPNAEMHEKFWRYMDYFQCAVFPERSKGDGGSA